MQKTTTTVDLTIRLEIADGETSLFEHVGALENLARSVSKYIVKGEREARIEEYTAKIESARVQAIAIEGGYYINKDVDYVNKDVP
jgi:hypothetical protein